MARSHVLPPKERIVFTLPLFNGFWRFVIKCLYTLMCVYYIYTIMVHILNWYNNGTTFYCTIWLIPMVILWLFVGFLGETKLCQDIWYNEWLTLNQLVAGSNPAGLTTFLLNFKANNIILLYFILFQLF